MAEEMLSGFHKAPLECILGGNIGAATGRCAILGTKNAFTDNGFDGVGLRAFLAYD